MITNRVSDLYRRAKQLADLEGTDFISWNESINAINEAYIGLYEKLINMGDNSFVESFRTKEKEVELPNDFWQLKGVYLWNNGNLETINRRSDNAGIHFLSYEMRNGKVYLFGNPNDVLIEYYKKPMTLMYPPVKRKLELPEAEEEHEISFIDCNEHTFLYADTYNDETTINIYDLDGFKTQSDIFADDTDFDIAKMYLLKNYVISIYEEGVKIYNISTGHKDFIASAAPLVSEIDDLFVIKDGYINELEWINDTEGYYNLKPLVEMPIENTGFYYCSDISLTDFFGMKYNSDEIAVVFHNETDLQTMADKVIYNKDKCYYLTTDKIGVIENDNTDRTIKRGIGEPIGFIGINDRTGYGFATKCFDKYFVMPYCEDTELNFPNSFYFQMLSYLLAIAFRCKQGADITLLSSQLDMVSQTFEDTLGSDNFQYPRMGNVYR